MGAPALTTTSLDAPARIGLVADTHGAIVPWATVHDRVARIFEGVDLIVHCGDSGTYDVLDALGGIAPVLGVRGGDDPAPREDLVDGARLLECGGTRVGVVFSLTDPPAGAVDGEAGLSFPELGATQVGDALFAGPVGAVVFGGTHRSVVDRIDGILFVNPGSPTLADQPSVAVLSISEGGRPDATLHPIG